MSKVAPQVVLVSGLSGAGKSVALKALEDLRSRGLDDAVFTAVCDNNEENAKGFAAELETRFGFKPKVYTDYRKMLAAEKLDAVDICLPHGLHHHRQRSRPHPGGTAPRPDDRHLHPDDAGRAAQARQHQHLLQAREACQDERGRREPVLCHGHGTVAFD